VTFHEAALRARDALREVGISPATAAMDADLLARHATGWDLATWISRRAEPADAGFLEQYAALIARRQTREPVAYIRGVQEFWGRDFEVRSGVLIPRPETELLVETAIEFLNAHSTATVVDVGTGSGCIAITLALEHPAATVHAIDISEDALAVARQNAGRLGAHSVRFIKGSYLAAAPTDLDLIVSNPPYVAATARPAIPPEVKDFEPSVALFGGDDGLRDIRILLEQSTTSLARDGKLIFEMGDGQYEQVEDEISRMQLLQLEEMRDDLQGIPRVAVVRRKN
jgi:release factor glutamine methyltransferase